MALLAPRRAVLVAESPTTEDLVRQQREALAQQQAAGAIEEALKECGQPYHVWIIAAEFRDSYAQEAKELTARLDAGRALPQVSTCEPA